MAGQLRYELIGDASRFEQAGRDVMNVSEQMEGSLSALEENIASLTQGQIRYNEEAERFRDAIGDFVAGADAQARALTELNSEGVRTTEQIQNQITRLERLEEVYEGDARAATDLQQEQQRLQRQLAEVGMSAAQQNQDLTRLDQQFEQATVAMTDFANRQQRLQQELLATAAAQDRVQSSGVTMRSSVSASANNLGFEFVQAAQDARYGAAGIANQIPLMTEQFTQLTSKTGSTTAALYALGRSLLGTVGVVGGITLALQWLPELTSAFQDSEQAARSATDAYQSAAEELNRLQDIQMPEALTQPEAQARRERLEQQIQGVEALQEELEVGQLVGAQSEERSRQLQELRAREKRYRKQLKEVNQSLQEREDRLRGIIDVQGDLLMTPEEVTPEDQVVDQEDVDLSEDLNLTLDDIIQEWEDQTETVQELRSELERLRGPTGALLAQEQQKARVLEQQIARQRALNRLIAEGVLTQQGRIPGGPGVEAAGPQEVTPEDIGPSGILEAGGVTTDLKGLDLAELPEALQESEESAERVATALGQGAGSFLRLIRQSKVEMEDIAGLLFQGIGSLLLTQVSGPGGAFLQGIIGSFAHGGTAPRSGAFLTGEEGPEIVNLPRGAEVIPHEESMRLLSARRSRRLRVEVQADIEPRALSNGDIGWAVTDKYQQTREEFGYT